MALSRILLRVVLVALGIGLPLLVVEGIHSLLHGGRAGNSLAYALYRQLVAPPPPAFDARDPTARFVGDQARFDALHDLLLANGVGIGNSPYRDLQRDAVAINRAVDGCTEQRPNLRKVMAFLRANVFNPFDPPTYFYDADRVLPSALRQFFDQYGFRQVHLTTNADGERLTVPDVRADAVVLVAGDSVANGALLDDSETISSRLQALDPHRQYVNLGIVGARTADISCALERATRRYRGTALDER